MPKQAITFGQYLSNLAACKAQGHTRITYHRTWETGLGAEI